MRRFTVVYVLVCWQVCGLMARAVPELTVRTVQGRVWLTLALPLEDEPKSRQILQCQSFDRSYSLELSAVATLWLDRRVAKSTLRHVVTCDPSGRAAFLLRTLDGRVVERATAQTSVQVQEFLASVDLLEIFPDRSLDSPRTYKLKVREKAVTRGQYSRPLAETSFAY